MRRANVASDAAWAYLNGFKPDVALLQEVNSIPDSIASEYEVLMRSALGKSEKPQVFSTAVLVRGKIEKAIELSSSWDWVSDEIKRFAENPVAAEVSLASGQRLRVMSVYSPAWPIDKERLEGIDVSEVKLKNNPDVWVTELMWAALKNKNRQDIPWVVAGGP